MVTNCSSDSFLIVISWHKVINLIKNKEMMKWFAAFSNDMIVRNDIQQGAQKNIPGKPPILTQKGKMGQKWPNSISLEPFMVESRLTPQKKRKT